MSINNKTILKCRKQHVVRLYPRFEVHLRTICGELVNIWKEDGSPKTFASRKEAQTAIDTFLADVRAARGENGGYHREDFRIEPAGCRAEPSGEAKDPGKPPGV